MIEHVKISPEEYQFLYDRGVEVDIEQINLENIADSGRHIGDILNEE